MSGTQWYGSLQNRMAEKSKQPKPVVGMGATELMYSDRHAYTICEVVSESKIYVQKDIATIIEGAVYNGSADYRFTPDPTSPKVMLTLRKDNKWHEGTSLKGQVFAIGYRSEYYDPSF